MISNTTETSETSGAPSLSGANISRGERLLPSLSPDEVRSMNCSFLAALKNGFTRWSGEGLGDGTSHRSDLGLGTRLVSMPISVQSKLHQVLQSRARLLVDELRAESDADTTARINKTFLAGMKGCGAADPDPALFSEETIAAVKKRALSRNLVPFVADFIPVPVTMKGSVPVPVSISNQDNTWQNVHKLVNSGDLSFAFLMMEAQSFPGYYGFARNYIANGAFKDNVDISDLEREVREKIYPEGDFAVMDYKAVERPGERHHALGDKRTIGRVWGADATPLDIRDILQHSRSGLLDRLRLMNTATPREVCLVLTHMSDGEREECKKLLNQPKIWAEHPSSIALLMKSFLPRVYDKYGPESLIIPSFVDANEMPLHYQPEYIISKPISGDSGYGMVIGSPEEVREKTSGMIDRLVQPLVDILRVVPNVAGGGVLGKGGVIELRILPLSTFGFTRVGAHEPYSPTNPPTFTEQEYIMKDVVALVAETQRNHGLSQAEAWTRTLMKTNAGFGIFKVEG